jgi:TolA-binding protein
MNIKKTFAALVVTGGITLSGATAAMAADPGAGVKPPKNQERIEKMCKRIESHQSEVATHKTRLQEQLTKLNAQLAENPDRAARIQVRIDRVKLQLDRIAAGEAWYAKNCTPPAPAAP